MKIVSFEEKHLHDVVCLWNESVASNSIYKGFNDRSFTIKVLNNPYYDSAGSLVMLDDDKVIGYGLAVVKDEGSETPGYITCVVIDEAYQRQGLGSRLLAYLEEFLRTKGKKKVRLLFFNPINLEWVVPNTNNHDHPGAPAIPFNTPFYFLLMANGYNIDGQQQDAYHLDIKNYEIPEKVIQRNKVNEADGYYIEIYDSSRHFGFEELFKALNNPGWFEAVNNNLSLENPRPMLVVHKGGEILGWTGPLYTQESGRGYFAGIGVHPKVQGRGLGKSLFCQLCYQSKLNKASFMTLFTGSENPARNIYLSAGFKIVQSFAILGKELIKNE